MKKPFVSSGVLLGSTLILAGGLVLSGCGGGGDGLQTPTSTPVPTTTGTPTNTSTPTPTPTSTNGTTTGTIATTGGTLTLPNIAQVIFPTGSFTTGRLVSVTSTTDADTTTSFNVSAPIYGAGQRLSYAVKVTTDAAPTKPVVFKVNVPASLAASIPSGQSLDAFAQIFETQGLSILDNFNLLSSTYDAASRIVTVTVPASAFTSMRRADSKFDAILTLAITPGPASTGGGSSSGCQGASIGSPLKSPLQVVSAFNPPTHFGTDYKVSASGEQVVSVADGTVEVVGFDERPLAKADPRSGKKIKGWGRYVIIKHSDGSRSLYAHLVKDSTNALVAGTTKVVKGQTVIGTTDNTGGSSGPHLHLEYAPNGSIFSRKNKIDPAPCIGTNVNTSIVVGDNGPAADDAFEVFIDGLSLGRTTIGGTNTLGASNLRPGNHQLKIVAVIAPDNLGTLGVALKDGLRFSDGTTTRSANLDQNEAITYTIVVPSSSSAAALRSNTTPALPRNTSSKEG